MKVVFMGTPEFAVPSLKYLIDAGHDVILAVTQPDRRGNRGKVVFSPVKDAALEAGIEVSQPVRIKKDPEFISMLGGLKPDVIVVAAFGQILPAEVLDIPEYGCINVHASLLPKLRGASPMQHAILSGDIATGVTIMRMNEGLDTGDMISKVIVPIGDKDIIELSAELAEAGAELLVKTLIDIEEGNAEYEKQDDAEATYAPLIDKHDGATDFDITAVQLERMIRAFKGWPSVYTYLDGNTVKIHAAEVLDEKADGEPGSVSEVNKEFFTVNCVDRKIKITELQMQGKKAMDSGSFLRGYKLEKGTVFKKEA